MASPLIEIQVCKLPYLCEKTTNREKCLLYLYSDGIITTNEFDEIRQQKTDFAGFLQLYLLLSQRLSPEVSPCIVKALQESRNNHIVQFLQSDSPPLTPLQKNQEGHYERSGESVNTPKETVTCPPGPKVNNRVAVKFHGGTSSTYNGPVNVGESIETKHYTTRGNHDHNH